ncbi:hypothetical protein Tco_1055682 [Tanacetum coccineum]|uniref:Uncharacterized protein n=1 Tax=Tanacetum coccineum TaxID=301880 RepID=A0ABQ5H111_9ASTR
MPPLTTVDRRSGGDSGDGNGTVPTPRGTTQVVTRGLLIIVCRCRRYEVQTDMSADMSVRGTRWQAEVLVRGVCQYEVRVRKSVPIMAIMRRLVNGKKTKIPLDLAI